MAFFVKKDNICCLKWLCVDKNVNIHYKNECKNEKEMWIFRDKNVFLKRQAPHVCKE